MGAFDGRELAYCQKACKTSEFSEKTADVKLVGRWASSSRTESSPGSYEGL